MRFKKQSAKKQRVRQPTGQLNESFRRNNVVISRTQREIKAHQQSVTQRQFERKKKQHKHHRHIQLAIVAVIIVCAVLSLRLAVFKTAVTSDSPFRLSQQEKTEYASAISSKVGAHTIAHQYWLLDSDKLTNDLVRSHPEIEKITYSAHVPFSTVLTAHIRFRTPVFVWRDATNKTQYVDKNGVLFSVNRDSSVDVKKLVHIEDQSGVALEPGTSVLTTKLVQFVGQIHSQLPATYGGGATIQRIIIPQSTREVQVQMTGKPYVIKLSSERTIEEQTNDLKILLGFLNTKKITPKSYIDLRLPHKAFYK